MASHFLSPTDHDIIRDVARLKQVTTSQLGRLHFSHTSPASDGRQCRDVLQRLERLGHIRPLERKLGGRPPGGFTWVRAESDIYEKRDHAIDIAELYTRVVEAERAGQLTILGEPSVEDYIRGSRTKYDLNLWIRGADEIDWYVEVDRGSEEMPDVRDKLRKYVNAYKAATVGFPLVIYVVTFAYRNRYEQRVQALRREISKQEEASLFTVCTLDEAVKTLATT